MAGHSFCHALNSDKSRDAITPDRDIHFQTCTSIDELIMTKLFEIDAAADEGLSEMDKNLEFDHTTPAPSPNPSWQDLGRSLEMWLNEGDNGIYRRALEYFDRLVIARVLQQTGGNQTQASERLGLSRFTLRAKLRSTKLAVEKVVNVQPGNQSSQSSDR